jgi:hypothetical protein
MLVLRILSYCAVYIIKDIVVEMWTPHLIFVFLHGHFALGQMLSEHVASHSSNSRGAGKRPAVIVPELSLM